MSRFGGDTSASSACWRWTASRWSRGSEATRGKRGEGTMGKLYEQIDDTLADFIGRQHVFFVGTAPDSPDGHLNVSPKGLDTFRILGPSSVAYLDLIGSGIETVAHLRQNGRVTIMFCAFEGRPLVVRLYGRGVWSSRATMTGTG